MANSKPEENRAGKTILSRAKIFFFFRHCKRSLEAVFSNMVSAGDGLEKRKGINKGFVIPASFSSLSSCQQSELWDSAEALRQECCTSLFPPAKKSPCSFFSLAPKICVSSGMLEPWHTQSWATPQPPTSSPCCQKTQLPSCYTAKKKQWSIFTHSFWVNGWPQTIFYRRQLTDLSLAPLKDPEFVFESCEIVHLPY